MSRVKFSLSFKLQVVKYPPSINDGQRKAGALPEVDQSNVCHRVNLYKQHGISGLYAVRHKYTAEEKECIIIHMRENKFSARQAAVELNTKTPHSIVLRERRCNEGGLTALSRKPREQSTVLEKPDIPTPPPESDRPLSKNKREELEYLRAENAYLEKLGALIQQQKSSVRKLKRK